MNVGEGRPGPAAPPGSGADGRTARARCGAPAAWRGALRRAGGQASVLREWAAWTQALGAGRIRLVPADPGWPAGATADDAAATTGGDRLAGDRTGTPARPFPYPARAGEQAPSRPYPRPGSAEGTAARRRTGPPDPTDDAPRRGGAPGPAEGHGAARVPRQRATRGAAADTGGPGQALRQAGSAPAPAADAFLPPDRGARPGPPLGHRPGPSGALRGLPAPGRGVTRGGRRDGLAGRALAALTPESDAVRGRDGAGGADPRVAAMRRPAPSDAGAQDSAGPAVPGDAMNTRAVAAVHPSLAVPRHQGGTAPAPFPDPFGAAPAPFPSPLGAGSAQAGTAATTSPPAAGSHARHASSQAAAALSPAARPGAHGDPVPDDSHADLREPPDLDDLADHLNRILCDEARRHGIDV